MADNKYFNSLDELKKETKSKLTDEEEKKALAAAKDEYTKTVKVEQDKKDDENDNGGQNEVVIDAEYEQPSNKQIWSDVFGDALVSNVTNLVPRIGQDLIHSVGRDQTKHMIGQLLKKEKAEPKFHINISIEAKNTDGINISSSSSIMSGFGDNYVCYKDVQDFSGLSVNLISPKESDKNDPKTVKLNRVTIHFGLLNFKKLLCGTNGEWEDFAKFLNAYNNISLEQHKSGFKMSSNNDEDKSGNDTKACIEIVSETYHHYFWLEKCELGKMAFQRITTNYIKNVNVARFSITGEITKVESGNNGPGGIGGISFASPLSM